MNCKIENDNICKYENIPVKNIKQLMDHKLVLEFLYGLKNGNCTKYTKDFLNNKNRHLQISFDEYKKYFGRSIAP